MNAAQATAAAPIYSTLANDRELADLVELFVDELPRRVAFLRSLFAAGDRDELERMAHQLKGAAGSYGFEAITPAAARVEQTVACGEPFAEIAEALEELIALCEAARAGAPR
ncbi:MAG: Hpt domain-containing protein [Pirellulales bacterium]